MDKKTLRAAALCGVPLVRQFGIRITQDQIEEHCSQGRLRSTNDLQAVFSDYGVSAQFIRPSIGDLKNRSYYFPCVAVFKNGSANILISIKKNEIGQYNFQVIDPLDPSQEVLTINEADFTKEWSGTALIVVRKSGVSSQDRIFNWRWFVPEFFRFKSLLVITFFISLITHLLGIAPIVFIQVSLDKVIGYGAVSTLYVLTIGALIALAFGGVMSFVKDYVINFISTTIEARLTGDLYDKILNLPAQEFQTTESKDFENALSSPIAIKNFISRQILSTIFDSAGIIVFLPVLVGYSPVLGALVISFAIVIGFISLFGRWREKEAVNRGASVETARRRAVQSSVSGIETIKSFSLETSQRRNWRQVSSENMRNTGLREISGLVVSNLTSTLQQIMTICLVFVGVVLALGGSLSAGSIISCNMLGGKLISPVKNLITFFSDLDGFKRTMDAVSGIWNGQSERVGTGLPCLIRGGLELRNVTVNFGDKPAIKDVSVSIEARSKVAIVGASGCGKTSLLRLFQGFLRPNAGVMEIDGQNYLHIDLGSYRSQVSMVSNEPVFFGATIEENLRIVSPNISEREFSEILEITNLGVVLEKLDDGISTDINQFGLPLSQGNRVTLAIARALISEPKVLLIDEALSSLDKASQVNFLVNIDKISHNKTLVMGTHDLRLMNYFDKIIVLNEGGVVGFGEHDALLAECKSYQALWDLEQTLAYT